jgi:ribosomal protein S18 acetylase RimI-like enzyme
MPVRRLTAEDASTYRRLRLIALRESPSSFGSAYEDEELKPIEHFRDSLEGSSERVFFGAFVDNHLVGCVGIEREAGRKEQHKAFLRGMYVDPANRGDGIGRALLSAALNHAEAWPGLEQVTLAVTASAAPAVALYRRAGFIEYGRAPRALLLDGVAYDELLLVRHRSAA